MAFLRTELKVKTKGKGLWEITSEIQKVVSDWNVEEGLLLVFNPHTSCSLTLNENADPSAKADLEEFFNRLAPENESWHLHTMEGPDDSPSHMKTSLTHSSLTFSVHQGKIELGVWQGIYLFEHRKCAHQRSLILRLMC